MQEFADQFTLPFLEASAKDGSNVEKAFLTLVKDIFDKTVEKTGAEDGQGSGGPLNITDNPAGGKAKKKKGLCLL